MEECKLRTLHTLHTLQTLALARGPPLCSAPHLHLAAFSADAEGQQPVHGAN